MAEMGLGERAQRHKFTKSYKAKEDLESYYTYRHERTWQIELANAHLTYRFDNYHDTQTFSMQDSWV